MDWSYWLQLAIMILFFAFIPIGMVVSSIGLWQTGNTWARVISIGYAMLGAIGLVSITANFFR